MAPSKKASRVKHEEKVDLLADGLVCLYVSYVGISIKVAPFYNQFKVPNSIFNVLESGSVLATVLISTAEKLNI